MSTIRVMDEILANKIAAGEVVERPLNVVKELVENAIDAKALEIKITLDDSGVKKIVVQDDGIGMDREDATLAFSRHATSKLKNLDDLFNISSLGFRGEALPSIASVSNVHLTTSKDDVGTSIIINGGKIENIDNAPLTKGTMIEVTDLFYNTPVRLKYLKNLYTELALIVEYVNKMALSYPNIRFILINNEKTLLNTTGDGNLLKVIYAVYGIDVTKKMIEINGENDDYIISGYIGYPEIAKTSRNVITTLVNGRVIKNSELNRCIIDCYHTYIPKDKFPLVVLNIDVDPILVDINIHPQKMDIKFSKFDSLKELITKEITKKLKEVLLVPHANIRDLNTIYEVEDSISLNTLNYELDGDEEEEKVKVSSPNLEELSFDFDNDSKITGAKTEEVVDNSSSEDNYRIKEMIPVGIVHKTYIIAENSSGMYIIDQHAAAERINYEKVLKALLENNYQVIDLLVPIKLEYSYDKVIKIKEYIEVLKNIGIELEEFGDNTFIVRSHPTWFFEGYEKEAIEKIIEIILEKGEFDKEKFIYKVASTMACKMSIKANDYLDLDTAKILLNNLRRCDNPFTCPHGRPTIITYSNYDLERLFKRAMN